MHPRSAGDGALFHLRACPPARGSVALAGELDLMSYELLPETLDRTGEGFTLRITAGPV